MSVTVNPFTGPPRNYRRDSYTVVITLHPSRAGEVYAVGSEPWQLFENQLSNKLKDGQRTVDQDPQVVLSAELKNYSTNETDGLESATVVAQLRLGERYGRIVDADGNTVYELVPNIPPPPDGVITVQYGMFRAGGGQWLIGLEGEL